MQALMPKALRTAAAYADAPPCKQIACLFKLVIGQRRSATCQTLVSSTQLHPSQRGMQVIQTPPGLCKAKLNCANPEKDKDKMAPLTSISIGEGCLNTACQVPNLRKASWILTVRNCWWDSPELAFCPQDQWSHFPQAKLKACTLWSKEMWSAYLSAFFTSIIQYWWLQVYVWQRICIMHHLYSLQGRLARPGGFHVVSEESTSLDTLHVFARPQIQASHEALLVSKHLVDASNIWNSGREVACVRPTSNRSVSPMRQQQARSPGARTALWAAWPSLAPEGRH